MKFAKKANVFFEKVQTGAKDIYVKAAENEVINSAG